MRVLSLASMAIVVLCVSCGTKSSKELQHIADLQDRRSTDSLLIYLQSDNIDQKRAAALALGSVQDSAASVLLGDVLLNEKDEELRLNAAFALGQIGNFAAVNALIPAITSREPLVRAEVLEALGKALDKTDLPSLVTVTETDSTTQAGVAWGLYRAGVRNAVDETAVNKAAEILVGNTGSSAKLGAAQFFARATLRDVKVPAEAIVRSTQEKNAEVRMAVVSALARLPQEEAIPAIEKLMNDGDYRVRANIPRALRTQPWIVSRPFYARLLADTNVHVTVAAAEAVGPVAMPGDSLEILIWAGAAVDWRTQAELYGTALRLRPSSSTSKKIKDLYASGTNDYQKASLITALSNYAANADFIFEQFRNTEVKVIKSTASLAIQRINKANQLSKADQEKFSGMYKEIILSGDHGSIIYACSALGDSTLGYKKSLTDYTFLEDAKGKLSLPRDYETYVPLERTLNYFKSLPPPPPLENKFNHPIDWKLHAEVKTGQKVLIQTTKGDITLVLFPDEAPGSVVNFVSLIKQNYYDGKIFHRVVPNFVIQTGCNRGDGFGGEDYSIRSEFSKRKYKTGSVGMASAGKDTEGTQWFITHSPTPHLDGKYTIFAEVVSGMDVVHKIEVGDKIVKASLIGL